MAARELQQSSAVLLYLDAPVCRDQGHPQSHILFLLAVLPHWQLTQSSSVWDARHPALQAEPSRPYGRSESRKVCRAS